jgi:hypothetical protein
MNTLETNFQAQLFLLIVVLFATNPLAWSRATITYLSHPPPLLWSLYHHQLALHHHRPLVPCHAMPSPSSACSSCTYPTLNLYIGHPLSLLLLTSPPLLIVQLQHQRRLLFVGCCAMWCPPSLFVAAAARNKISPLLLCFLKYTCHHPPLCSQLSTSYNAYGAFGIFHSISIPMYVLYL